MHRPGFLPGISIPHIPALHEILEFPYNLYYLLCISVHGCIDALEEHPEHDITRRCVMKPGIKKRHIAVFCLVLIICYLFWGPLFPWSPVTPGFIKTASEKAAVYIQKPAAHDSIALRIDCILLQEEQFHGLTYTNKIKILILNRQSSMKRYLPWMRGSGYSVSLSLADLVYIGPNAQRSEQGIEPYLKHELSHMLIGQNTTFKKAMKIHNQGWLAEGTAEYFSGHTFYTNEEFADLCAGSSIDFTSLQRRNPLKMPVRDLRLQYTFYRLFIEYLIDRYGLETFQRFLKWYIQDPDAYEKLFAGIYGIDMHIMLEQCSKDILKGTEPGSVPAGPVQ